MWPWPEGPDLLTSPEDYVLAIKIVALVVATQPLTNVIVKFRADYTPKPVQLHADPEDNADASPSTNGVSSVFQMAKRVFQIEVWFPGAAAPSVVGSALNLCCRV